MSFQLLIGYLLMVFIFAAAFKDSVAEAEWQSWLSKLWRIPWGMIAVTVKIVAVIAVVWFLSVVFGLLFEAIAWIANAVLQACLDIALHLWSALTALWGT